MYFISFEFLIFITLFVAVYYFTPMRYRYIPLFIGNCIFYLRGGNFKILLILLFTIIITYAGGLALEKKKSRSLYCLFFALNILILLYFKYTNFGVKNINKFLSVIGKENYKFTFKNTILPIGLSFYTFQTCTYLGDVYKGIINAERNIIKYASYASFFPTILSGPIEKSRDLLPQIKKGSKFDFNNALKGMVLFIWGTFEKVVIATSLSNVVNTVFGQYKSYTYTAYAYYWAAAICFSLYIYADFSAYSDMARGIAKILGINIKRNFCNPYFSRSLSEFWNRWHVSLNEWFTEYVYIPLGGNRKGNVRKYINIFIVFAISGLWHGAEGHFLIWGIVNGILVIFGRILKPVKIKFRKFFGIDEDVESIVFLERAITFLLITITWIFFNNGMQASVYIIREMLRLNPVGLFVPDLLTINETAVRTFFLIVMTAFFCVVQACRREEKKYFMIYKHQPVFIQCLIMAGLLYICIFTVASSANTDVNTSFLYFQF